MAGSDFSLVGLGLYSVPEAAAYTGIPGTAIRRWIRGYKDSQKNFHPGLWVSPLANEPVDAITFADLLELRFVQAFRKHNVSLQAIRLAARHARELFNSEYPFTCHRFQTDGRNIFATVREETGDHSIIDLAKKQAVFASIIRPSLYRGIEYNDNGAARRWYPLERSRKVMLDPSVSFGRPVASDSAVPTEVLYEAWLHGGEDEKTVAKLYEVSIADVEAAVRFEKGFVRRREILH